MNRLHITGVVLLISVFSCKNTGPEPEDFSAPKEDKQEMQEIREIIYSMYLPTDLAGILEKTGTNFDPSLPAPVTDIKLYQDPEQIAIMLGIYGVDLSYMKILEQPIMAAEYFRVLEALAGSIDIPREIFDTSSRLLEKSLGNKDSLALAIQRIYMDMDMHFTSNNHLDLMALSLMGGWIEAMYIGTQIYNSEIRPVSMAEKILQQKYSLNSVISVLSKHQESLLVSKCLLMLKKLKKEFETIRIMYDKEGFDVDTTSKKIVSSRAYISYDESTLNRINSIIRQIRWELIKTEF